MAAHKNVRLRPSHILSERETCPKRDDAVACAENEEYFVWRDIRSEIFGVPLNARESFATKSAFLIAPMLVPSDAIRLESNSDRVSIQSRTLFSSSTDCRRRISIAALSETLRISSRKTRITAKPSSAK